jgi:hypothetical protein
MDRLQWLKQIHQLKREKGWDQDETNPVVFFSTING